MGFSVEHECPQCGAPIDMEETDHLVQCPYCDVKSYLFSPDYMRYILPHKTAQRDIIYAPYLRFKGSVYHCRGTTIGHRIVDITQAGLELKGIPASLGLRPQAMKVKSLTPETRGMFLRFSLHAADIVARAGEMPSGDSMEKIHHMACIGETMSLIYLPLFLEGKTLFDAVLNRRLADLPESIAEIENALPGAPENETVFIPTLCPKCGWNLEGKRDSVVLVCKNCLTAWEAREGRFAQVDLSIGPGRVKNSLYLPFWRFTSRVKGVEINSFADFIRVTNQPKIPEKEWEKEDMDFWCPAFKIRPKLFLTLSRRLTISQARLQSEDLISGREFSPVTLPRSEAGQALKIILAVSTVNKKDIFPRLPRIDFVVKDTTLVFLPFTERGQDVIQEDTGVSVNRRSLEYGRKL